MSTCGCEVMLRVNGEVQMIKPLLEKKGVMLIVAL